MKLFHEIESTFSNFRERPAVSIFSPPKSLHTLTYGVLEERVKKFSHFLQKQGMQPDDFVMIYMKKSPQLIEATIAVIINWGTPSCLNQKVKPIQVFRLIKKVNPKFIIIDQSTLIGIIRSKESLDVDIPFILYGKEPELESASAIFEKVNMTMSISRYHPDQCIDTAPFEMEHFDNNIPGFCLFTSGSTGDPKAVLISRDDLFQRAITEVEDYDISENDCLLSLLPFSFDVGLNQLFSSFLAGAHLVILISWFPKDILSAIKLLGITGISSVPLIWVDMISYPKEFNFTRAIESLRYITVSGGDLSENQLLQLRDYFGKVNIYKTYGQTETFRSGILKPDNFDKKMTSVGKPPKGTRVFILDQKGEIALPNIEGEIIHYGVGTMVGYKDDLKETKKKLREIPYSLKGLINRNKIVFTGDSGKLDEEGYLYVLGRKDGMLKISGNRVYPKEVENCILEHKKVKYAAVVGIKDGRMGQVMFAAVIPKGTLEKQELAIFLYERLPSYMLPSEIQIVESLPMTETGKINYVQIKDKYEERRVLSNNT